MSNSISILTAAADRLSAAAHLQAAAARTLCGMRRLWRAYWDYQARRATHVLLSQLDDRVLADIGLSRDEIESASFASPSDRSRAYDPEWYLRKSSRS